MKRIVAVLIMLMADFATAADMHQEFGWKDPRKVIVDADLSANYQPFSCTIRPRNEYLVEKSVNGRLKLDYTPDGECRLAAGTGKWVDHYARTELSVDAEMEVDHVVPLREAWDAGASQWSRVDRRKFATDPINLRITAKGTNRTKSDKQVYDYEKWAPEGFRPCDYAKQYAGVKGEYSLTFTAKEVEFYIKLAENGQCTTNVVTTKTFGGYKAAKWVKVR
jgi:hypothetical protein